jgi:hypothetical protein
MAATMSIFAIVLFEVDFYLLCLRIVFAAELMTALIAE